MTASLTTTFSGRESLVQKVGFLRALVTNPIIRKEVLMSLRTRKAIAMQVLFLVIQAGLLWLYWPATGMQDAEGVKAREILSILAIGEMAMVALFAPAFTAASLTVEKERKTLESLFATALRPWEIAYGKIVGSLAFLVLVVASGAIGLAAPLMLGDVRLAQVLAVMGLLLLTAVFLGAIGLFISTFMHRSYRSIILTYAVLLVICFFLATPAWPITGNLITRCGPVWQGILHVLSSFSPLEAMISVVLPDSGYATGAAAWPPFWQVYVVLASVCIVALAAACIAKLSRPVAPPRPREELKVIERDGKFTARSVMFLVDPRKRKRAIRWWQNPVLIKEFRTRPMLQSHWLVRASLTCLISAIVLMVVVNIAVKNFVEEAGTKVVAGTDMEQVAMIPAIATSAAVLMVVMIILIGPAMASGAISSDRETGVWELLRTTRMSSWRIASGKFQASIIPLLLITGAVVPALAILIFVDTTIWINVLRMLAVAGSTVFFVSSAGMFFSSLFPRTSTATAWTYGLVITLGLLTLLTLLGDKAFSGQFVRWVLLANPVAAVMEAGGSVLQGHTLFADHLKIMLTAGAAMFVVTVIRVFQLRRPD
ncbi:MAG: ABC transporter permease [Phycisphaerae bacterium]